MFVLAHIIRTAVEQTAFLTKPHPANPHGWPIAWGTQLDVRPLRVPGDQAITDTAVAGYLAKYATKGTDATGHTSKRITTDTIDIYADDSHPGRIINAAWDLGSTEDYEGLRRWAHMLGFGGHFFSKSRRYSTTFRVLRQRPHRLPAPRRSKRRRAARRRARRRNHRRRQRTVATSAPAGTPPATPCSPTPARPWPANDAAPQERHWHPRHDDTDGERWH